MPFSYRGTEAQDFANRFFDGIDVDTLRVEGKLSLKILIVKPDARLSWQYHHPRAEIWQVYKGEVGIIRSDNDTQGELLKFKHLFLTVKVLCHQLVLFHLIIKIILGL